MPTNNNSASLLFALLASWHVPANAAPQHVRKIDERDVFVRDHMRAVGYLLEINDVLRELEAQDRDVEHWRRSYFQWWEAVLSMNLPWGEQQNGDRAAMPEAAADQLRSLSELIDVALIDPPIAPDERDQIRRHVLSARDLITSSGLPPKLKLSLLALIAEVLSCLDEYELMGPRALRKRVEQLGGALLAASGVDRSIWQKGLEAASRGMLALAVSTSGVIAGFEYANWREHGQEVLEAPAAPLQLPPGPARDDEPEPEAD